MKDTPTPYTKELKKGMNAAEDIMADTETPMRTRVAAVNRLITFWSNLVTEIERKGPPSDDPL